MSNTRVLRRFDAATVADLSEQMSENAIDGFIALWYALEPAYDELESVRPGDYAIPYEQTTTFIDAMSKSMDKGQVLLLWLNKGPGTIEAA